MPILGLERFANPLWKPIAQSASATGSLPTIITPSPMFLTTRASPGSVSSTASTNRSIRSSASASPASSVNRTKPTRSANAIATRSWPSAAFVEVGLHVRDHLLLDEVPQELAVEVLHQRSRQRQQLADQVPHLLRHLHARHAVAHQRLVDVEVEEARLGVRDLAHRVAVNPHHLEERDERETPPPAPPPCSGAPRCPRRRAGRASRAESRAPARCARSAPARGRCPPRPAPGRSRSRGAERARPRSRTRAGRPRPPS